MLTVECARVCSHICIYGTCDLFALLYSIKAHTHTQAQHNLTDCVTGLIINALSAHHIASRSGWLVDDYFGGTERQPLFAAASLLREKCFVTHLCICVRVGQQEHCARLICRTLRDWCLFASGRDGDINPFITVAGMERDEAGASATAAAR